MRVLALAFAVVLLSCTAAPSVELPTPVPTHETGVLNVSVLLDLSGSRPPSGQPQRDAMLLWVEQLQRADVRLRLKFVDVGGSDARLLLELRRAAVEDHADAIVIGAAAILDEPLRQAVQIAAIPVLITVPTDEPVARAGGRFTFALAPTPDTLTRLLVNDLAGQQLLAPMLIAGNDSATAVQERNAFLAELRKRAVTAPTPVSLALPDAPERVRGTAAVAKSVVLFGASAPYGDVIRAITVSPTAPRVYLSYLTETADITNLREQSALVTWPGSPWTTLLTTSVQRAFLRDFTDRHGAPSALAAAAFDALTIIQIAALMAPSELEASQLRLRIETNAFRGVSTRYTFTPQRHAGFAPEDVVYLLWNTHAGAPFVATQTNGTGR
ncbi:MAG: ABC transporter substrate-binding protein [Chloroflexota bacterium]|nr:ABC transporter substrate-binding protein [Chloroflexota bacterium]